MGMKVPLLDLKGQYLPLRKEIRHAIDEVCDAQTFTLGPLVERFERNLAHYCQTKFAIGVSSGTDALLCALMAVGVGADDEVICPSFTFFATAGVVARLGAIPVFADIEPETFNLDPAKLEARITKKTKAIIPVHLFGQMADMEAINAVAERHGIAVIEDAAQAIGAKRHGHRATIRGWPAWPGSTRRRPCAPVATTDTVPSPPAPATSRPPPRSRIWRHRRAAPANGYA